MKSLFSYALAFFLIVLIVPFKVHGLEKDSLINKSQIKNANQYAERFCSAKADHFFEGLDNEKTLKYSYFQYIGLMSDEIVLKDMYKSLINQIREKCIISNDEEKELNELFTKKP